ncbi:MAG: hypothetical protein GTO23_02040 [Nitrososphaeria archaeon]|nr:hypothetical protein [Nitrososphaeria archaeon]
MQLRATPILVVVGKKDSGKTRVIEYLVSNLAATGMRVAILKHVHHPDFTLDIQGKDSWKHARASIAPSGHTGTVATAPTADLRRCSKISGLIKGTSHGRTITYASLLSLLVMNSYNYLFYHVANFFHNMF